MTEYALALSDDELARYERMAETSLEAELELWAAAGVVEGAVVADVGCGPGAISVALARLVGPTGRVFAIDAGAEAVAAAEAMCERAGVDNVTCARGAATDTGLEPGTFDVVMMRHVLAHNGPDEQRIVDHLATLVRPGGFVYLADNDVTAIRIWPPIPDYEDLIARYRALHAARGNDLMVGLRLDGLLEASGLDVLEHRGRYEMIPSTRGFRGPPWAARDAMVEAGVASEEDLARWGAMFDRVDSGELQFKLFVTPFCAVGRRPE